MCSLHRLCGAADVPSKDFLSARYSEEKMVSSRIVVIPFLYDNPLSLPFAAALWALPALVFDAVAGQSCRHGLERAAHQLQQGAGADPTLPANQDRITANTWITRGDVRGLYNAAGRLALLITSARRTRRGPTARSRNYASLPYTNWNYWPRASTEVHMEPW